MPHQNTGNCLRKEMYSIMKPGGQSRRERRGYKHDGAENPQIITPTRLAAGAHEFAGY